MSHNANLLRLLGIGALGVGIAATAQAAVITGCTITSLKYTLESAVVVCNNDLLTPVTAIAPASTLPAACVRQSTDTIKVWSSMLQSSMLGGRPVKLIYTPMTGSCAFNLLTSVEMN